MSFTKGFWVTIIILTLNRQQGTQRTAWARAERGDKPPPADASPSRSSPTCHCHSDPDSQIKPSRKTPGPFGQPNTKTLPEAATKHTPAFECREAVRDAGREALQSADSTAFIHPQPQPPPSANNYSSVSGSQGGRNWKHVFIEAQLEFHEFHYSRLSQHFLEWIL